MAIRNTFKAYERLKREQHIDTLFRKGKAFSVFPLRFIYLLAPLGPQDLSPVQVGFTVSKKKFRSSVQRNRVRRLMREAWRLQKHDLYAAIPEGQQLHVFVIFTDATLPAFDALQTLMAQGMEKLQKTLHA